MRHVSRSNSTQHSVCCRNHPCGHLSLILDLPRVHQPPLAQVRGFQAGHGQLMVPKNGRNRTPSGASMTSFEQHVVQCFVIADEAGTPPPLSPMSEDHDCTSAELFAVHPHAHFSSSSLLSLESTHTVKRLLAVYKSLLLSFTIQQTTSFHILTPLIHNMATPSPAYLIQCAIIGDPPPAPALADANTTAVSERGSDRAPDTPSNYIPGLYTLGTTYNVLNGKYADSKSTIQQVVDWSKSERAVFGYLFLCLHVSIVVQAKCVSKNLVEGSTAFPTLSTSPETPPQTIARRTARQRLSTPRAFLFTPDSKLASQASPPLLPLTTASPSVKICPMHSPASHLRSPTITCLCLRPDRFRVT